MSSGMNIEYSRRPRHGSTYFLRYNMVRIHSQYPSDIKLLFATEGNR